MTGRGNLSVARALGFASVVVWVVVMVVYASRLAPGPEPEVPVAAGVADLAAPLASGNSLAITVRKRTTLRVTMDDAVVVDRRVEPPEELAWEGAKAFTVEGAAPEALRIVWNGQQVVPLGRQDEPRRLVFVDDQGER